jgi:hypothetical protein
MVSRVTAAILVRRSTVGAELHYFQSGYWLIMGFLIIYYDDGDRHVPENAWVELLVNDRQVNQTACPSSSVDFRPTPWKRA